MTIVLEIAARIVGALLVIGTLWSALLTVVVPRAERPRITRYHFKFAGLLSRKIGARFKDPRRQNNFDARLAPLSLVTLSFVWALHIIVGFALVFWGQGIRPFGSAMVLSGSSLTTLGIRDADTTATLMLVVVEGLIGLGLVGLMITYLPTIYGAYLEREVAVARLEVRAGRPAHPVTFLERAARIGWLGQMDEVWTEWEDWFLKIEETHTTHISLSFFRSAYFGRSWLVTAGTVLESAALMHSVVDAPQSPRAALCIRSGFTTLGNLADVFLVERPQDPHFGVDPISIQRDDFDALCAELEARGVPLKDDRDQAWLDFAGWRVNYDASLMGLSEYLRISPGAWFGEHQVTPTNAFADDAT